MFKLNIFISSVQQYLISAEVAIYRNIQNKYKTIYKNIIVSENKKSALYLFCYLLLLFLMFSRLFNYYFSFGL